MSSAQELYSFLFYMFLGWILVFGLVLFAIEFFFSPDDSFYIKYLWEFFIKIYGMLSLIIVLFNYKLLF